MKLSINFHFNCKFLATTSHATADANDEPSTASSKPTTGNQTVDQITNDPLSSIFDSNFQMMTDDRPTPDSQHSQQFHMPPQQVSCLVYVSIPILNETMNSEHFD